MYNSRIVIHVFFLRVTKPMHHETHKIIQVFFFFFFKNGQTFNSLFEKKLINLITLSLFVKFLLATNKQHFSSVYIQ